jgi:hypothetical protein
MNKYISLKVGNKTGVDYTMTFSKQVLPEDFVTKFHLRTEHKSDGTNIDTYPLFTVYFFQKPSMGADGQEPSMGADNRGYHTPSLSQTQSLCLRNSQRRSFPMQKNNNNSDLLCLLRKENCPVCSSCMWSRRFHVLVKFQQN